MGRKRKRKPHFFKILLGNFYERLRIPPSFMKHIIVETSESATLEGPDGSIWDVKLDRAAKETYFCEGWSEFVKDHSLEIAEFLVFRYDGNLHFTVQIFGVNACEREELFNVKASRNPPSCKGKKKQGKVMKKSFECSGITQLKACKSKSKKHRKGANPFQPINSNPMLRNQGKVKVEPFSSDSDGEIAFQSMSQTVEPGTCSAPLVKCHDVLSSKPNGFQQMKTELVDMPSSRTDSCRRGHMSARRPVTKEEKTRAWTAAISFKPNYPHFVTEMKVSNVYRRFILLIGGVLLGAISCIVHPVANFSTFEQHIPRSFSKEHLPKEKTMLTLYDPRGKAWTVSYTAGRNGRDAITGGWTAFSRDNDLQVGDVCVFELFGNKEMYVNIFRVVPEFIPQKKESET